MLSTSPRPYKIISHVIFDQSGVWRDCVVSLNVDYKLIINLAHALPQSSSIAELHRVHCSSQSTNQQVLA